MEKLDGGGGGGGSEKARRWKYRPPADRFLRAFEEPQPIAVAPVELSEDDIFATGSESSSAYDTQEASKLTGNAQIDGRVSSGILVALSDDISIRSRSDNRAVFSHKASASASRSPLSLASAATPVMTIPKRPPPAAEKTRFHPQSAPVNVPVMPAREARGLERIPSDDELDETDGVMLPPHEMIAARYSPILACSVLEGAGRTLKGRDLRQVRNAIWRKTGFLD